MDDMCPYGSYSLRIKCDCVFCQRDNMTIEIAAHKAGLREAIAVVKNFLHHDDLPLQESYLNDEEAAAILPKLEELVKEG